MTSHDLEKTAPVSGDLPRLERVRHELRRRELTVAAVERLTPHMIRITLEGAELQGFTSMSADDHIKIFAPDGAGAMTMRDYTPRRFDPQALRLAVDFAVHEAGPATQWALGVKPGDSALIAGPRGSLVIGGAVKSWLLIGDETALPAIGRRIEEMTPGMPVTSVVAVPGPDDEQDFETAARLSAHWVHRTDPTDAAVLIERLRGLPLAAGTFVWIAAESSVVKAVRAYLTGERHLNPAWMRAAGYWVMGKADTTEKFES